MAKITLIGREAAVLTNDIKNMMEAQLGVEVNKLHPDKFLAGEYEADDEFLITYQTEMLRRQQIVEKLNADNLKRATFIHSSSIIDPTAVVHPGTFIGPFCIVAYESVVGPDCLIAPYTLVAHRATLDVGCITNPGATIAGAVHIGKYCLMGIRCVTVDQIDICDNVVVGPNAFVSKTITVPGRYLGSPARRA
ncbi:NeuD_NnaD, sugar O-acyltransferase, sialic acid O-acetyltransferase NeuD family [uncultured Caudovirales phage]|uniref:NeuD_NnaD, sugar O-acyltransferase, sialic acid O-acetyltransferase NeuD family n=1 Tax=uncultured Caudovirales phage TaxID=2100421 RepID=A0A6J5L5N0_9CAUD|nr:NeuD_NnaD, sugar O-acyltransferase, sialic acid O-acetyltransferase NeuD family [uncultured Caudovirales phage]